MNPENERKLESRVIRAAEQSLAGHQYALRNATGFPCGV